MIKKIALVAMIISVFVAGCSNKTNDSSIQEAVREISKEESKETQNDNSAESEKADEPADMAQRSAMSAEEALELLIAGNQEYLSSDIPQGDISPAIRERTKDDQHPYAVIVTCSDSRVPPEFIFSAGIGDLFVIRLAGNVIDDQQLGSIEYAAENLGCSLVIVLGHTNCGAVGAAITNGGDGYIKFLTDEVKRAIGNETDELKASCLNTLYSCMRIEESFEITDNGNPNELTVVGAMYHIEDGRVEILGNTSEMKEKLLQ